MDKRASINVYVTSSVYCRLKTKSITFLIEKQFCNFDDTVQFVVWIKKICVLDCVAFNTLISVAVILVSKTSSHLVVTQGKLIWAERLGKYARCLQQKFSRTPKVSFVLVNLCLYSTARGSLRMGLTFLQESPRCSVVTQRFPHSLRDIDDPSNWKLQA